MKYHFKYYPDKNDGYYAEGIELKDCQTEAETLDELKEMIQDMLNIYLDEDPDSKIIFPPPSKKEIKGKNIIAINPDPNILFAQTLRMLRVKHKLSIKDVIKKIGYKKEWDYLKFEKNKAIPNLNTLIKLKEVYPELDLNKITS